MPPGSESTASVCADTRRCRVHGATRVCLETLSVSVGERRRVLPYNGHANRNGPESAGFRRMAVAQSTRDCRTRAKRHRDPSLRTAVGRVYLARDQQRSLRMSVPRIQLEVIYHPATHVEVSCGKRLKTETTPQTLRIHGGPLSVEQARTFSFGVHRGDTCSCGSYERSADGRQQKITARFPCRARVSAPRRWPSPAHLPRTMSARTILPTVPCPCFDISLVKLVQHHNNRRRSLTRYSAPRTNLVGQCAHGWDLFVRSTLARVVARKRKKKRALGPQPERCKCRQASQSVDARRATPAGAGGTKRKGKAVASVMGT